MKTDFSFSDVKLSGKEAFFKMDVELFDPINIVSDIHHFLK